MNNIPKERLQEGMLCFIKEKQMYYQWNNSWDKFVVSSDVLKADTENALNKIDTTDLLEGTLCYVRNTGKFFVWNSKEWKNLIADTEGEVVNYSKVFIVSTEGEMNDLNSLTTLEDGALCYVKTSATYYTYNNSKWNILNQTVTIQMGQNVIISNEEPEDKTALWVDTNNMQNEENLESIINNPLVQELLNSFKILQGEIKILNGEIATLKEIIANGGFVPSEPIKDYCFLTEEGDFILTEDGDNFVTEDYIPGSYNPPTEDKVNNCFLTEDNKYILTEDGKNISIE